MALRPNITWACVQSLRVRYFVDSVCYRPQRSWGKVIFSEACVHILSTGGGHAWLLPGGVRGCSGGVCMVARGAFVVAPGGGGMHGIRRDTEIRSMSGRYASYWNAFLFTLFSNEISQWCN